MAIQIGTPDEERIWLFSWQSRPHISSCDANRILIDEQLTALLLALTVENVTAVMDSLFAVGRLAPSTDTAPVLKSQPVEPAEPEEPAVPDFRKMTVAELRRYLKEQNPRRQALPEMYTRDVIRGLSRQSYEKLSLDFGSQQVRDRLAGRN